MSGGGVDEMSTFADRRYPLCRWYPIERSTCMRAELTRLLAATSSGVNWVLPQSPARKLTVTPEITKSYRYRGTYNGDSLAGVCTLYRNRGNG